MQNLKEFLEKKFGDRFHKVSERPTHLKNTLAHFVIETNSEVINDEILKFLEEFYPGIRIIVRGEHLHWVILYGNKNLLINVENKSDLTGGAHFFGGSRDKGAIGFEISEHPK